jgi:acyl-CoA dehydrogenase
VVPDREAAKAKAGGGNGSATHGGKACTGRFFAERMLPAATTHLARIKAGAASMMALPAEAF